MDRVTGPTGAPRRLPGFGIVLRAILVMQLQSWRNATRRGLSNDPAAAAIGVVMLAATVLMSLLFGLGAFAAAATAGQEPEVQFWMAFGVLFSSTMVSVFSGAASESGDIADARRLQVYPITRENLLRLEVAAQVFSQTFLFFLPAVLGIAAGLLLSNVSLGRPFSAMLTLPAMAGGLVAGALIVRIIAGLVAVGGRRVREIVAVLMAAMFMSLAFLGPVADEGKIDELGGVIGRFAGAIRLTPPGAAAGLAVGDSLIAAAVDAAVLGIWLFLGWTAHTRIAGRLLDGRVVSATARKSSGRRPLAFLDGLAGASAGAAIADFRSMLRMPSLWILLLFPAIFGFAMGRSGHAAGDAEEAELAAAWLPVMAAFAAQVFFTSQLFSNLFGNDHAGAAHFVLAPVPVWRLLAGKTASRLVFGGAQVAVFFTALSFRVEGVAGREFVLAFLAWVAGALWVSAAGAFISIRLPFRMATGVSQERGSRVLNSLLGQLLVASVLIPPAMMILGGRAFRGESGYLTGIGVSLVAGVLFWSISAVWCSVLWEEWGPRMVEDLTKG